MVNEALATGRQVVTHKGEEVVVISKEEFGRLKNSQPSLADRFRQPPLVGVELDLDRDQTRPREIEV